MRGVSKRFGVVRALDDVTLAYDVFGDAEGEPVILIGGCGQPALAWQVGVVPVLVGPATEW